jgi:hypothetical protein
VDDILKTLALPNLRNDLPHRVYIKQRRKMNQHTPGETRAQQKGKRHSLKITPINVKMKSCEIIKNAKYRATTARSSLERVIAPWYFDK